MWKFYGICALLSLQMIEMFLLYSLLWQKIRIFFEGGVHVKRNNRIDRLAEMKEEWRKTE